jgi:hypothetical protein
VYSVPNVKNNIILLKNKTLRTIIMVDIHKFRNYLNSIREVNTKVLTNYYASIYMLNSLTDEERIILDYLVSLSY